MLFLEVARRQRQLSQKALSQIVRIDQAFLSMVERGYGNPDPDQIARLARALDLPPDKVLQHVPLPVPDLPTEVVETEAATRG